MRHGYQAGSIGMAELMVAARDTEEIPTLRLYRPDDVPASHQISPNAFMLLRPCEPTMT
jgi:hypothetical protein